MSVANLTVKQVYQGDGANTTFAIPSAIIRDDSAEIKVVLRDETDVNNITETLWTEGVEYNLTGAVPPGQPFNTDVEAVSAPTLTQKLVVHRELDLDQDTVYQETSPIPVKTVENTHDYLTAVCQQLNEKLGRVPSLSIGTAVTQPLVIPEPEATVVWGWDSDKETFRYYTPAELLNVVLGTVLLAANNLSDLTSVPTAIANLGISPFGAQEDSVINNNELAPVATGYSFVAADFTSKSLYFEVARQTDTQDLIATGRMTFQKKPRTGTWVFQVNEFSGDTGEVDGFNPCGVTFSAQVSGSDILLNYISDSMTGGNYAGTLKISEKSFT